MMRSDAATVMLPVNFPSVRFEVRKVGFRVFGKIADGIIESLVVVHPRHAQLSAQALFSAKHITGGWQDGHSHTVRIKPKTFRVFR